MLSLEPALQTKYANLQKILKDLGSVVVAFSGGVDSTVVLKVAVDMLGESAKAVIAASPTLPASELEDAHRLCQAIGVTLQVVKTDQLQIRPLYKMMPHGVFIAKRTSINCFRTFEGPWVFRLSSMAPISMIWAKIDQVFKQASS